MTLLRFTAVLALVGVPASDKDAHEAKWWFLIGLGGLWIMHIAGFIADRRSRADIINAIQGVKR
jgi:hypothetical protein